MKIRRPDWASFLVHYKYIGSAEDNFNKWFDKEIAPYEFFDRSKAIPVCWSPGSMDWTEMGLDNPNVEKRALLIEIEPIKKETADNLLKELVEYFDAKPFDGGPVVTLKDLVERAKRVLGEK